MYNIRDYYKYLSDFLFTNILDKPRLSVIMFYATSRCNSRCNICNIWKKQPKEDVSFEIIKKTLGSKCIDKQTRIGFEGGEFILHPEVDRIIEYTATKGYNYELLTNGLLTKKIGEIVKEYNIPRVYISLDGSKETYLKVRGIDGYEKVMDTIDLIKNMTNISIIYTINPWNDQADLDHIVNYCKDNSLDLRLGIYNNMEFFDTTKKMHEVDYKIDTRIDVGAFPENKDFLDLYEEWEAGNVLLPCYSIRQKLVVYPNGDIPICQNKQIIIGNLYEQTLDEIVDSYETKKLQKENKYCNGCWINFHRKFEVALYRNLGFLPKPIIKRMLGEYRLPNEKIRIQ